MGQRLSEEWTDRAHGADVDRSNETVLADGDAVMADMLREICARGLPKRVVIEFEVAMLEKVPA
jgi:hypothetical protein